jgi:hypothetical protein
MLLNKLMNALNKAMEKEQTQSTGGFGAEGMSAIAMPSVGRSNMMENQLRGPEGRMFWKCYFNAVSCF